MTPSPARRTCARLVLTLSLAAPLLAQEARERTGIRFGDPEELAYDEPFFPGATYAPDVPAPEAVLGQRHGSRLAHHAEVLAYFRALADSSPRVTLASHGFTHEGRELVHAVLTSPANHARLDALLGDLARLADPRGLSEAEAQSLLARAKPVAWMAYSIHGDELSGTDASMAVGHLLAADTRAETAELLDRLVVVIDPCQNPDGRERIISMVEQSAGYTPNLDYASMQRGRWPYGRGNHYLFDMNRDWMAGTQPETRGRWAAARTFHPQLFVDAHEMGSLDTFLFYPQAEPINPAMHARLVEWQSAFADEAARAFDRYGWSYYSREWADGWAPFYSDAWGSLVGAIGILYEQARTAGFPLRRAAGELLTYREAVHHQAVASLANLRTLAARGDEVLASWAAGRREGVAADAAGNDRVLAVLRGPNPAREQVLLETLLGQGIEVYRTSEDAEARAAEGALGQRAETLALPAGTLLVPARQGEHRFVRAYLELDQRMDAAALQREREDLERKGESRIYDVTAWSLVHSYGLDAWWVDALEVASERVASPPERVGAVVDAQDAPTAWAVDGADDAAVVFAARAMELGLHLNLSDVGFTAGGRAFPRGSLLLRRAENPLPEGELAARVARAAEEAGALVHALGTQRSPDAGPDLGGQHFTLLARPRVALLGNAPVSTASYGHLWHQLDRVLGVPVSILDAAELRGTDWRRYNVLVLPPGGVRSALEPVKEELETWVEAGGTLVACEDAAVALTRNALGLSSDVLRRDVLDELDEYAVVAERQWAAREIAIDEEEVWSGRSAKEAEPAQEEEGDAAEEAQDDEPDEKAESLDAWRRRFAPYGAALLAWPSPEAWITAGCPERMAVDYSGSAVLLSRRPAAVRLGRYDELRLSGLLWPEARERIAESCYVTVERKGAGQLILFIVQPAFRGYQKNTARLFANAVVYGPGAGARQPVAW